MTNEKQEMMQQVFKCIRDNGLMTVNQASALTSIYWCSVSKIADELCEMNLLDKEITPISFDNNLSIRYKVSITHDRRLQLIGLK